MDWYVGSEWKRYWSESCAQWIRGEGGGRQRVPIPRNSDCHFTLLLIFTLRHAARHWSSHTSMSRTPLYHTGPTWLHDVHGPCTSSYMMPRHKKRWKEDGRWDTSDTHSQKLGWKDTLIHGLTACLPICLPVPLSDYRYPCVKYPRISVSLLRWHERGKTGAWSMCVRKHSIFSSVRADLANRMGWGEDDRGIHEEA